MKSKLCSWVHEMKYQIILISQLMDKSKFLIRMFLQIKKWRKKYKNLKDTKKMMNTNDE